MYAQACQVTFQSSKTRRSGARRSGWFWSLCFCAMAGFLLQGSISVADEKTKADHGSEAASATGHGHSEESHSSQGSTIPSGMIPKPDLMVWSLITFGAFVFLLSKFAWKPLAAGLDQREARIRNDIHEAESARVKAQQLLAEHEARLAKTEETVRELIAEAKRDAEKVRADLTAAAEADVQTMKKRAVSEIEQARDVALQQLFDTLSTNVMDATSRIVGRSLNSDDHQRLVQEALAELNVRRN